MLYVFALPVSGRSSRGLLLALRAVRAPPPRTLRVCADPDNLPYSSRDGSGFENRIARIVADELQAPLQLHWQPQRRGFVRKTLGAGRCDVLWACPPDFDRVLTTEPITARPTSSCNAAPTLRAARARSTIRA